MALHTHPQHDVHSGIFDLTLSPQPEVGTDADDTVSTRRDVLDTRKGHSIALFMSARPTVNELKKKDKPNHINFFVTVVQYLHNSDQLPPGSEVKWIEKSTRNSLSQSDRLLGSWSTFFENLVRICWPWNIYYPYRSQSEKNSIKRQNNILRKMNPGISEKQSNISNRRGLNEFIPF